MEEREREREVHWLLDLYLEDKVPLLPADVIAARKELMVAL